MGFSEGRRAPILCLAPHCLDYAPRRALRRDYRDLVEPGRPQQAPVLLAGALLPATEKHQHVEVHQGETRPLGRIRVVLRGEYLLDHAAGDATGKGVPAALVMSTTCGMLQLAAQSSESSSPGEVLEQVNETLLARIPPNMFVTCFYAILDPKSATLSYANAGHRSEERRVGKEG